MEDLCADMISEAEKEEEALEYAIDLLFKNEEEYDTLNPEPTGKGDSNMTTSVYLLVNKLDKEEIQKRVASNIECISVIEKYIKKSSYGKGLYCYFNKDWQYLKSKSDRYDVIKINIKYNSHDILRLANVTDKSIILNYNKLVQSKNLTYSNDSEFIECILKVTNVKPKAFIVFHVDNILIPKTTISEFIGEKLFIRDLSIISSIQSHNN